MLVGNFLLMQLAFGLARAAHKFVDHLLWQTWRRAIPVVRQEIDVKTFGGSDAVDFHLLRQRNSDCTPIGVAARNTYDPEALELSFSTATATGFLKVMTIIAPETRTFGSTASSK